MPGKVPLYQEASRDAAQAAAAPTYAALLEGSGKKCVVAPACADLTDAVLQQLADADVLFFDGTLFRDDEMITAGLGGKPANAWATYQSAAPVALWLASPHLKARKIFFHINNSNPMLLDDSPERRIVEAAGFEVSYDGMKIAP